MIDAPAPSAETDASESAAAADPRIEGGPRTHAAASRQRRDLVSGEVMDEARLIRFAPGPGGEVAPDLGARLPGRGLWVEARREAVAQAVRRGGFSRSAKTKLRASADLPDQVERLLMQRLLAGLGLARRAGELISGFEKTAAAIEAGRAAWLVEASDGADDGRRKMLQHVGRSSRPPEIFAAFDSEELGLALGLENVIHLGLLRGRGAARWTVDVRRLNGFRPLVPETWREGSV